MAFYDGRILRDPQVSRRLVNTRYGPVELQTVTIELDNTDDGISGDLRGVPFDADLYDEVTGTAVVQGSFVVSEVIYSRVTATLVGINMDLSALE